MRGNRPERKAQNISQAQIALLEALSEEMAHKIRNKLIASHVIVQRVGKLAKLAKKAEDDFTALDKLLDEIARDIEKIKLSMQLHRS